MTIDRREAIVAMLAALLGPSILVRSADEAITVTNVVPTPWTDDMRSAMDHVYMLYDKKVGLLEMMYGANYEWRIVPGSAEVPE